MRDGNYSTGIQAGISCEIDTAYRSALAVPYHALWASQNYVIVTVAFYVHTTAQLSTLRLVVTVISPPSALNDVAPTSGANECKFRSVLGPCQVDLHLFCTITLQTCPTKIMTCGKRTYFHSATRRPSQNVWSTALTSGFPWTEDLQDRMQL